MIYINIVKTTEPMKEIKVDRDFSFFKDYQPQEFKYPTSDAMASYIKTQQMNVVIAGKMTGDLRRNNQNVFSRSLLFLDFDDIQESEEDFLSKIHSKLDSKLNYCLYPSLRYRPDFLRYRLVLELDREVNSKEYEILLFGLSNELGIKFEFDESNKTWSQGQGLPLETPYSKRAKTIYHDEWQKVPVEKFLQATKNSKEYREIIKKTKSDFTGKKSTGKQKYTGILLRDLFNGAEVGNRNSWWREMTDKMLSVDTPVETIQEIMETINNKFTDPLPTKELETIFLSRVKNHVRNGGDIY